MADNTTLPGTGTVVRDKDRSGTHTQLVALDLNPAGAESLMGGAIPVTDNAGSLTVDGTVTAANTAGDVAHDAVDSGNPVKVGLKSVSAFPTAVATGDRSNLTGDLVGRAMVTHIDPAQSIWQQVEATTAQTGTAIWTPASGKKIVVTSMEVAVGGITAGIVTLWFGAAGDTTYTQGTDQVLFRGEVSPSATQSIVLPFAYPLGGRASATVDYLLRYTTSAAVTIYITVYGYEI